MKSKYAVVLLAEIFSECTGGRKSDCRGETPEDHVEEENSHGLSIGAPLDELSALVHEAREGREPTTKTRPGSERKSAGEPMSKVQTNEDSQYERTNYVDGERSDWHYSVNARLDEDV